MAYAVCGRGQQKGQCAILTTHYKLLTTVLPPRPTKKIILPNKPHLDPIVAYYLLLRFGKEAFPGIETAEFAVWTHADTPPREKFIEWEGQGTIGIDISGGLFDHHSGEDCATIKVATYLGLIDKPELQNLFQYVQEDDSAGIHNKYGDLAYVIKCLYKAGWEIPAVMKFAFDTLDVLQKKETTWHVDMKAEYDAKAKMIRVQRGSMKLKIVIIESDAVDIANYARQRETAAVVVQRRSSGHVFIFTNKVFRVDLQPIIAAIRQREIELSGGNAAKANGLTKEGKHPLAEQWYYHPALNALLNGSDALLDTPATKIPFKEIVSFVLAGAAGDLPQLPEGYLTPEQLHQYGFRGRTKQ